MNRIEFREFITNFKLGTIAWDDRFITLPTKQLTKLCDTSISVSNYTFMEKLKHKIKPSRRRMISAIRRGDTKMVLFLSKYFYLPCFLDEIVKNLEILRMVKKMKLDIQITYTNVKNLLAQRKYSNIEYIYKHFGLTDTYIVDTHNLSNNKYNTIISYYKSCLNIYKYLNRDPLCIVLNLIRNRDILGKYCKYTRGQLPLDDIFSYLELSNYVKMEVDVFSQLVDKMSSTILIDVLKHNNTLSISDSLFEQLLLNKHYTVITYLIDSNRVPNNRVRDICVYSKI
jgi:hypothetical protein